MRKICVFPKESIWYFFKTKSFKTGVYRGIQRNYVWDKTNKEGYKQSLINNTTEGNFVLADVQTCLDMAKHLGNVDDEKFFQDFLDKGMEYISIDGNNRTKFIQTEFKEYFDDPDKFYNCNDTSVKEILNREIELKIIQFATKKELHEHAINLNSNKSWNHQEKRNSMWGEISNYVRDISQKYETVSEKIKQININRLGDDEMFATFLNYSISQRSSIHQSDLNSMYKNNTELKVKDKNEFERVLSDWGKVIKIVDNHNRRKSFSYNMFYFLWEMSNKKNYRLNLDKIEDFVKKYIELEDKRLLNKEWFHTNRNASQKINQKVENIIKDFKEDIDTFFFQMDAKRRFSTVDRLNKCIETNGIVERLDGTFEIITPSQAMYDNNYEADHIIPHSKGGKTDAKSNLALITKSDNRKKKDKILS